MDPTSAALRHASMLSPGYRAIGKAPPRRGLSLERFRPLGRSGKFLLHTDIFRNRGGLTWICPCRSTLRSQSVIGHVCVSAGERSEGSGVSAWSSRRPEVVTCGHPVKGTATRAGKKWALRSRHIEG
jgi:hypothetical protein